VHSYLKGNPSSEHGSGDKAQGLVQKVVVLHGLGGIGKTSIALEYAFRYAKSYTTVLWADVTSGMSLAQTARGIAEHIIATYAKRGSSYEQIAATLGLSSVLDARGKLSSDESAALRVTEAVKEWLAASQNEEWLLVLDNYDDVDAVDIHHLLPTCDAGSVIITSRKSNLQAVGKTVAVDEIDEDSGMALFLKSANKKDAKADGKPCCLFVFVWIV
jgi:MinD-like ATPase involved in chromosome partitioning or flagellar assembly